MNYVTIQLRSFQDYDIAGKKMGETSYGFSIFDDYDEKVYLDMDRKEFSEFLNNPQEILELAMQFYEKEFKDLIISTGGFYISDRWYRVDLAGNVKNIA